MLGGPITIRVEDPESFVGHFGANGGILPRFGGHFAQTLGHFAPARGGGHGPSAPPLDQPLDEVAFLSTPVLMHGGLLYLAFCL